MAALSDPASGPGLASWAGCPPHALGALQVVWPLPLAPLTLDFVAQAIFTLLLGPFAFFDVQKTKYLQILTSLMRWIGESEGHRESPLVPSVTCPQLSVRGLAAQPERGTGPVGRKGRALCLPCCSWGNSVPKELSHLEVA